MTRLTARRQLRRLPRRDFWTVRRRLPQTPLAIAIESRDRRPLSLERLEPRQLMATTATLDAARLAVSLPVTFQGDSTASITWRNTQVGQFTWTNASGDAREAGLPASFTTFCIDGLQGVVPGRATTFTDFSTALNANPFGGTTSAMGVDRANLLTQFWNQFGPADNANESDDRTGTEDRHRRQQRRGFLQGSPTAA